MTKKLIRFDWAIKRILRDKENFDILEGFLSELLGQTIQIEQILESESNQETDTDKHNRVDLLVKNQLGELVIIEVQNSKEYDYFHRMLFGTSKVITQYIKQGDPYANIKKVISVTIAYFDLGQGKDYVYHGTNRFVGIHFHDELELANKQKTLYKKNQVQDIFPEYWIIKADQFNDKIVNALDEWIYFLKNSEVLEGFSAKGLQQAKEKLDELRMSEKERREYQHYLKNLMNIASERHTKNADIEELLVKREEKGKIEGKIEEKIEVAQNGIKAGLDNKTISMLTGLSEEEIQQLREKKNRN
ncbi:MAG: Rpn family recombination-promoting nuclease/putative transposase [Bacteroidota bacterium]